MFSKPPKIFTKGSLQGNTSLIINNPFIYNVRSYALLIVICFHLLPSTIKLITNL